jgi:hypothetical protein
MNEIYEYVEHKHRFAAWAGATAARSSPLCRFRVAQAVEFLNSTTIANDVETKRKWESWEKFDSWHKKLCEEIISKAQNSGLTGFSFGVAAKLVNCYVKAFLISELDNYRFIHPPIDDVLLQSLIKHNYGGKKTIWKIYQKKRWSKFTDDDYYEVIKNLRQSVGQDAALWRVESHWQGYQA